MKNFLTTEQMVDANKKLRERLEAKQPGCTSTIPVLDLSGSLTLDEILDEDKALKAVESAQASQRTVAARGASVAASYAPAGQMQIASLKSILSAAKPGGATHKAMTAKLAALGVKVEGGTVTAPGKATSTTPTATTPKLTLTQRCLKAKGLPLDTKVAIQSGATGSGIVEGSEIADD